MIRESEFNDKQRALYQQMSAISEECYFARRPVGLEYVLWYEINLLAENPFRADVPEPIRECCTLSKELEGWIVWRDACTDDLPFEEWGPYFVSLKEWRSHVAAKLSLKW